MTAAITVSGLSKTYPSRRSAPIQAVDNLDLTVERGEVIGLLGPNGAGKTTTIKMICGLIVPDRGSIEIQGIPLRSRLRQAMRNLGAVLEGTRNVYWRLTPLQNLAYSARLKGVRASSTKQWGERLLKDLELWDRRHDPVREFSRGMQQKTAIACSLIHNPPILLLDEPTLGLDIQAALTVKEWIRTLSSQYHKTLVLTTHQLDLAEELCQRVAIVRQGTKIADQDIGELRKLYQRELLHIRITATVDALRPLVQATWPEATLTAHPPQVLVTVPAQTSTPLTLAEAARVVDPWPFEVLSIEQAVPSLEDIFLHVMDARESHD